MNLTFRSIQDMSTFEYVVSIFLSSHAIALGSQTPNNFVNYALTFVGTKEGINI